MLYIKKILFFFAGLAIFLQACFAFAEETYDPFSDYNDFHIIKEEEQDINFFNDGRFISLGFQIKHFQPTGELDQVYGGATGGHIFMTYFFDLRLALQFSIGYQDHIFKVFGETETFESSSNFRTLSMAIKYYINPDRIVYAFSKFNPYLLVGAGYVLETRKGNQGVDGGAGTTHTVYHFALGFELPFPGKKFFLHSEAGYHFSSSFGQEDEFKNKVGDFISGSVGIGMNF